MKSLKDMTPADQRFGGEATKFDRNGKIPFVSCFRVVKGFENRKNYKVEPLPKEYHALFQEKV